jgi:hypothetical protein
MFSGSARTGTRSSPPVSSLDRPVAETTVSGRITCRGFADRQGSDNAYLTIQEVQVGNPAMRKSVLERPQSVKTEADVVVPAIETAWRVQ